MAFIVPAYAGILAIIYVALSLRVVAIRRGSRISLGHAGNAVLERRIRAHGNFAEYVPLALLLLSFMELQGSPAWQLHTLCLVLIVARLSHAYAVSEEGADLRFRVGGVVGSIAVIVIAALRLLLRGLS